MNPTKAVPSWPVIDLVVQDATRGTIRGRPVRVEPGQDVLQHLLEEACAVARSYGRALRVSVESPTDTTELVADPSGRTTVLTTTPRILALTRPADPGETDADTEPHSAGGQDLGRPVDDMADDDVRVDDVRVDDVRVDDVRVDDVRVDRAAVELPPAEPSASRGASATSRSAAAPTTTWYQVGGQALDVDVDVDDAYDLLRGPVPSAARPTASSVRVRTSGGALRRNPLPGLLLAGAAVAVLIGALAIPGSPDRSAPTGSRPANLAAAASAATSDGQRTGRASAPDSDADEASSHAPTEQATPVPLAAAPPGYAAEPVWAVAVNGDALVDLGPGGLVATRTPDGRVIGLDAASGKVRWWIPRAYADGWTGPRLTRIDDEPVVAMAGDDQLVYWPVPDQDGPVQDDPTSVPLPVGAALSWAGPSPLIALGPGSAAVVRGGALQLVPLPAGARPLAAVGADVLAVRGATWVRARAGGPAPQVRTIATPPGAAGAPVRVETVSGTYLLAAWAKPKSPSGAQTVALVDAASGKTLLSTRLPAGVDISRGGVVRQVGGSLLGTGPFVVDTDVKRLKALLAQYRVVSLTPGHVYARDAALRRTVDIRTTDGQFQVLPLPDGAAVPFAAVAVEGQGDARGRALVITSTPTGSLVQALPAA